MSNRHYEIVACKWPDIVATAILLNEWYDKGYKVVSVWYQKKDSSAPDVAVFLLERYK